MRLTPRARLCDVGEAALLQAIRRGLGDERPRVDAPGDDAALVSLATRRVVVSTDMLVEDKDFRLSWASYPDIGAKAAMVNLSDLAAMGASPRALLLSVAMKRTLPARGLISLVCSADEVGRRWHAPVVGGDLSEIDGPMVVSVTAIGDLCGPAMVRHRGQIGDVVCVTGKVGQAAAGLSVLESPHRYRSLPANVRTRLHRAQLRPQAPVHVAPIFAASRWVRSAADVSDGLLVDAMHIAPKGAGVVFDTTRLPVANCVWEAARCQHRQTANSHAQALHWALTGGEDFGLLLACAPQDVASLQKLGRTHNTLLTPIGRVVEAPGVHVWPPTSRNAMGKGFAHFQASPTSRTRRTKRSTRPARSS